jgi:alpha,alpha-trehalose phosphorylase
VTVGTDEAAYVVEDGDPMTISHWGEELEVGAEELTRPIPPAPELEPVSQPRHREPHEAPGAERGV